MKISPPVVKEIEERTVASVSFTGNYVGNTQVFSDLFTKLCGWAGPKGLMRPDSVFLSAYYGDPRIIPPDELKLDVCMSVPEDTVEAGDVQIQVLPGGEYAVTHNELTGAEEFGPAWDTAVEWVESNNYIIDPARPCYEIYLNNPEEHPEKLHIVDIFVSVIEKQ